MNPQWNKKSLPRRRVWVTIVTLATLALTSTLALFSVRPRTPSYLGVRLLIADASPIAKLVRPELVRSSLRPYLTNSDAAVRMPAQEVLNRAGFTNLVVNQINVP